MSNAPATRYSDRDVRENTELFDIAARYLQSYHGDFEYLLDMQRHYTVNGSLSVAMTRGVLNCMRNDPRVAGDLPAPQQFPEQDDADVVPMGRASSRRGYSKKRERQCNMTMTPHYWHTWGDKNICEGVPWPINRESFWLPANVKRPYVMSKYARAMIHGVAIAGNHCVTWSPPVHEYGMARHPELHVKLICRYPSILKNPILLTDDEAEPLIELGLKWCRHCFPELER